MPDDQPTPEDDRPSDAPRPTRGAGWDDDEWVRRDLGPRPEVPGHGSRPLLMALPIFLITIAAVIALLVAGCGDDGEETAQGGDPAPTSAQTAPAATADAAAKALAGASGPLLAGRADAKAFADATCEPVDGAGPTDFRCAYGNDGDADSGAIRLRLSADGAATKILGTDPPTTGQKTSADTRALLLADDEATGAAKVDYVCATSTPVNPDGTSAGTSGSGQRCVLLGANRKPQGQRYVSFAADGTVQHDYLLPDE